MSEYLYNLALFDPRVRPLVFVIKDWASSNSLIQPGPNMTSFTLTLLIVYYLQSRSDPILPSINMLDNMRVRAGNYDDGESLP